MISRLCLVVIYDGDELSKSVESASPIEEIGFSVELRAIRRYQEG